MYDLLCIVTMATGRHKQAAGGPTATNWYVPKTPTSTTPTTTKRGRSHTTTDYENVFGDIRKPKGNTLLQLFGDWLFRAAIWPSKCVTDGLVTLYLIVKRIYSLALFLTDPLPVYFGVILNLAVVLT